MSILRRHPAFFALILFTVVSAVAALGYFRHRSVDLVADVPGISVGELLIPGDHAGFSGLARDPNGGFLTVSERQGVLLALRVDGDTLIAAGAPVPVEGVPEGLDLESLAFIGEDHRVAIGTEVHLERSTSGRILLLDYDGSRAVVSDELEVPLGEFGLEAEVNGGIEGLCAAGRVVLAGTETVQLREDGSREAPIMRYDEATGEWDLLWLELTTETGKLSSLDCWLEDGALQAVAIERHYGVGRLLRFALDDADPTDRTLRSSNVIDLLHHVASVPNLEGVVRASPDGFWLLSDNQGREVHRGPTLVLQILPEKLVPREATRDEATN